jgi:hypothetical protein
MSNSIDIVMNIVDAYKKMRRPTFQHKPLMSFDEQLHDSASSESSVSSTLQVPMMGAMDSKAASSTPTLFDLPHSVFKQVLQLLRRETQKRKRLELQQKLPSLPIGRPSPFVKQQLRVLLALHGN